MKSLKYLMIAILMLSFTACESQIKNAKTQTVRISGNCEMCEKTIETAGNLKKTAKVDWNKDTKEAIIIFDSKSTNLEAILKRIALAGYDNEKYLATKEAYAKLPECCQYEREKREVITKSSEMNHTQHGNQTMEAQKETSASKNTETNQSQELTSVFASYFKIKDALVASNGSLASENASKMAKAIDEIQMDKLENEVHIVWMKVMKDIKEDAEHINETKDHGHQRDHFTTLSKRIYDLMKVSKLKEPTYLMFCPMYNKGKGANWLSKEEEVKNPYYGSQMLGCGSVKETLK